MHFLLSRYSYYCEYYVAYDEGIQESYIYDSDTLLGAYVPEFSQQRYVPNFGTAYAKVVYPPILKIRTTARYVKYDGKLKMQLNLTRQLHRLQPCCRNFIIISYSKIGVYRCDPQYGNDWNTAFLVEFEQ